MKAFKLSILVFMILLLAGCSSTTSTSETEQPPKPEETTDFVQYGEMHEVIGMQQHQGRILLTDAIKRPNLFAVGAIDGLTGEITILDGEIFATNSVTADELSPLESTEGVQAALLVGFHVADWTEQEIPNDIAVSELEGFIESNAKELGIDTFKPFPFAIDGKLIDLELHVIRGACPLHSKRRGVELTDDNKPYHAVHPTLDGRIFGVFAKDAAGVLTHPNTSTHTHIVFKSETGLDVTGHVERTGVGQGATLRLPRK